MKRHIAVAVPGPYAPKGADFLGIVRPPPLAGRAAAPWKKRRNAKTMPDPWDTGERLEGAPVTADAFTLLACWNYSLATFYLRRWQRQMEMPLRLVRIASPSELVEARRAFEEDLLSD